LSVYNDVIQNERGIFKMGFEQLFDEYYDKIFVYINRRINNAYDAEDLTADVFVKAFANPYDPKLSKFSTYIYTIAANALKNYYRSEKNRNRFAYELDEGLPDITDILGGITQNEEYVSLKRALADLPQKQYDVIYHRYFLEESFAKIGTVLDITEVNARKIHQRALNALSGELKKVFEEVSRFG
jgi:RNA polymerase sigma-70 factor (ECF subfamily)